MMNYLVNMNRHLRLTIFIVLIFTSFYFLIDTGNLFFALLFFVFLGMLIASNVSHARNTLDIMKRSLPTALNKNNFQADLSYLSDDFLSGIALNESENKILILKRQNSNDEFIPSLYDFDDILECSIKEDNQTVTKTVNSSSMKRAIAGGILFGGVGTVIGGITGEKITTQKIYKATLYLGVNDIHNPVHEIHFLNSKMLMDKTNPRYQNIYANLNKWHKTISVIIKRNELNSKTV